MKQIVSRIAPVWLGLCISALVSVVAGLAFFAACHERGSAFYPFATLAFLGGPLIGGSVAAVKAQKRRRAAFFASGSVVFALAGVLFVLLYLVLPLFERTSFELTAFGDSGDGGLDVPDHLKYTLPAGDTGIRLAEDAQAAVVVTISDAGPPFPSTVFLVNKSDGKILRSLKFNDDIVMAIIDDGIGYIYNDKLLYMLDVRTGEFARNALTLDNYGGLSATDRPIIAPAASGRWYLETTAVISTWGVDGTVRSRRHLTFNCVALGCFTRGDSHEVTKLRMPRDVKGQGKNLP
jgi:hypothetical protein